MESSSTSSDPLGTTVVRPSPPSPGASDSFSRDDAWASGARLGRYVLREELGRGGMGRVFRATDPRLGRDVALKLLHGGTPAGPSEHERLIREARALAQLSHPNVVAIYDAGRSGAHPFIAMELVDGRTLRQWCGQAERPWRTVVETFLEAGRGLAAAHAAGFVHRDFKPSNVLIGWDGRVKVVDFGLVRQWTDEGSDGDVTMSTGGSDSTLTGMVVGTPLYMAPEQYVSGREINHRCDQYAFCVALYQALFGRPPFDPSWSIERIAAAKWRERVHPFPRRTAVPASIRRALMRGLAAAPSQRFPDMPALLDALRSEPRRRIGRWIGAAVIGTVALAAWPSEPEPIATCRTDGLAELWDPDRLQRAIETANPSVAASTWPGLRARVDAYVQRWTGAQARACAEPAGDELRVCLDDRRLELAAVLDELARDPQTVLPRALRAVDALSDPRACLEPTRRGDRDVPSGQEADPEAVAQARALLARAKASRLTGGYPEALRLARELQLPARTAGSEGLRIAALLEYGYALSNAGDPEAVEVLEATYHAAIGWGDDRTAFEAAVQLIGILVDDHRDVGAAEHFVPLAEAALRRTGSAPGDQADLTEAVGGLRMQQARLEDARLAHERAIALRRRADPPDPVALAISLNNLAMVQELLGEGPAAEISQRQALAILQTELGPAHPNVATALGNLAITLDTMGRYYEAKVLHEQVIAIRTAVFGAEHLSTAIAMDNLGATLAELDQRELARDLHERALKIRERTLGLHHPTLIYSISNLQLLAQHEGEFAKAREYSDRLLLIHGQNGETNSPGYAHSLSNRANLERSERNFEAALQRYRTAVAILEAAYGPSHPDVIQVTMNIGLTLNDLGRDEEARPVLERVLAYYEAHPHDRVGLARTRYVLAKALWSFPAERARARALAEQGLRELEALASNPAVQELLREWLRTHRPSRSSQPA